MRKSSMILLAILFVFSVVLAGCNNSNSENNGTSNGGENSSNTQNNDSSANSQQDNDKPEPYELVVVYPSAPQPDEQKVEEAINEYLIEKINATVDLRPIDWGPWNDQRNLMIGSREKVDIYFTAQWTNHAVNVAKGAFMDLGDLLQSHGQGILETLDPAFLEGSKINGINYGIPTNKELAAQGGILYRTDIAEQLGIDMSTVKSIADLEPVFKKVKEETDMTPIFLKDGETFATHYMANMDFLGNTDVDGAILKDGTETVVKSKLEIDRYREIIDITRDYFLKGYINQDAATTQTSTTDALKSGQYFSIPVSLKPGKDKETEPAAGLQGKLGQIALNEATVSTGETAGAMLAISTTSENPEAAMRFINLLHTDKYLINLLVFGIEGVHFTRNGEIISATDQTGNYAPNIAWEFGNQFLNYVWDTEAPDKWEQFKKFNEGAKLSPALGFTFDAEPIKTEAASLLNVKRSFDAALETGSVDPENTIPKYLESMKAAGLDIAIQEKQDQLDAFLNSK